MRDDIYTVVWMDGWCSGVGFMRGKGKGDGEGEELYKDEVEVIHTLE